MNTAKEKIEKNLAIDLVREMCEFTAQQSPANAERAMRLASAFESWATAEWIERVGNGTMTGKEWVRAAMSDGFIPA